MRWYLTVVNELSAQIYKYVKNLERFCLGLWSFKQPYLLAFIINPWASVKQQINSPRLPEQENCPGQVSREVAVGSTGRWQTQDKSS